MVTFRFQCAPGKRKQFFTQARNSSALRRAAVEQLIDQQAHAEGRVANGVEHHRRLNLVHVSNQLPRAFFILERLGHALLQLSVQHIVQIVAQVFSREDLIALFIDALALRVEHIIIFQQVLANIEIRAFHPLL